MARIIHRNEHRAKKKKQKMILKNIFLSWCIIQFSEKNMENVKKHREIKLVTTEIRRNYLVLEPNYHSTKFFAENLLAIEMIKTRILMNKLVSLGISILELSKIVMYEFWYNYVKSKYEEKVKLCYMDTDSFIIYIKNRYL